MQGDHSVVNQLKVAKRSLLLWESLFLVCTTCLLDY